MAEKTAQALDNKQKNHIRLADTLARERAKELKAQNAIDLKASQEYGIKQDEINRTNAREDTKNSLTDNTTAANALDSTKKKEIKAVAKSDLVGARTPMQKISKMYLHKADKRTEMLEGSVDQIVDRMVDIFKKDIKAL